MRLKSTDRDAQDLEPANHLDPGSNRVEGNLLGRLAQRGGLEVDVVGLDLAPRERHLAAVQPVVGRPLGQDHDGRIIGRGHDQDEDGRRPVAGDLTEAQLGPRTPIGEHRHERGRPGRQPP